MQGCIFIICLRSDSRKKGGVSVARIDAYAYYLSTYSNIRPTRYDSHKKSDLRKIYNNMVKVNSKAPLYKLSNQDTVTKYAIDIKENAKSIQNVVASLSDNYGDFSDSFRKKVAVSSEEDSVSVAYVGNGTEDSHINGFNIEVKQLSTPQLNVGNYLKKDHLSILPGSYSFDLNINNTSYEFQYTVKPGENNLDVMKKLAGLVNRSSLGITATIKNGTMDEGGIDTSALALTSRQTGRDNDGPIFEITPGPSAESIRTMEQLGIQKIAHEAENSTFLFNGIELHSSTNSFIVEDTFDLTLNKVSEEGHPATISFKTDLDAVEDNVMTLVKSFNNILDIAEKTSPEATGEPNKLFIEMCNLSRSRRESLGEIGLIVAENGMISIDKEQLKEAIQPERAEDTFSTLSRFKNAIGAKADSIAINPMNYVNKVIVNYKHPNRTFTAPYFSSVYSGMMLDRYV